MNVDPSSHAPLPRETSREPLAMTDLVLHIPGFLDARQCDLLIEEHRRRERESQLEHCPEATSGVDTYSTFKAIDLTKGTEAFALVHTATEEMINRYHRHLEAFGAFHTMRRGSMTHSHKYRLLKYETGAKIHPHTDHGPFVYGSCTFNLNDDYEGGSFSFFNGRHEVQLGRGDAMIWPADYFWVHAVEPITKGTRYSTNSFLQSLPESVLQEVVDFAYDRMKAYRADPSLHDGTAYRVESGPRPDRS